MTGGYGMNAKNIKTGQNHNALSLSAKSRARAVKTWLQLMSKKSLKPEDLHARLIFMIGAVLASTFFVITAGAVYALVFVTQPIGAQAPNDRDFIQLLQTLAIFLTGALGGVLAGNGLKSKSNQETKSEVQE